jgi:lipopolysaccharide biosynthesis glycosyltransferase
MPLKEIRAVKSKRAICTIIAKNYLAFARTLADSFLSIHPDYKCYVLIVDDISGHIYPAQENFEIVTPKELDIPNWPSFCFKYNVTELCTAVKAHLLAHLLDQGIESLLYLDPDILVTANLDGLFESLDTADIVITPHLDTDFPDDGLQPDDAHIMRSGAFNLGFIGVSNRSEGRAFLEWWKPKLYWKCVIDHERGYFVDQKFIDLVPTLFDNYKIEKDTGYNVAYWNLHSRQLNRDDNGNWRCNTGPLYFFHFSNYRPEVIGAISKHTTRYRLDDRPDLAPLFTEYQRRLMNNGYEQSSRWSYTFNFYDTGERIPPRLRVSYRSRPENWEALGDPFRSPLLKRKGAVIRLTEKDNFAGKMFASLYRFAAASRTARDRTFKRP